MKKSAIRGIIALMTLAVIGSIWLQVNWIQSAVQLNEEEFDNNVVAALNDVATRLKGIEQSEVFEITMNGFSRSFLRDELRRETSITDSLQQLSNTRAFDHRREQLSKTELFNLVLSENNCNCSKCTQEREQRYSAFVNYYNDLPMVPIVERVGDLSRLDDLIRQELEDHGINIPFRYGVYSSRKKSFVIADEHYVVEDHQPNEVQLGFQVLLNSNYKVSLYDSGSQPPGSLHLFFPSRASFVWSNLWRTLIGTILTTTIIMFCFGYTILVIYNQKKLAEMKTDFINNMTHEFKTPIATISLAADSINSPKVLNTPDRIKRFIGIIKAENKRMNNQVEKVLQMAAIDRNDVELNLGAVNLHEVIERAAENAALQIANRQGHLNLDLQATNPIVEGDLTHLSNMVNNLLDNANKYSPENPQISIATRDTKNGVAIAVTDQGQGMTREQLKYIFDKFYRAHTGNRHDVKGFGLGLSYVKAMVNAHNGTIDVKSDYGKGSTFTVTLPARQPK